VALITVEEMWINVVEEMDNRDPKGDKVPLMESVFKEFDSVRFNVSSGSLHSNLKRLHSYYWKETLRSLSQKGSSYLPSSHTQFSHWIPQLAIQRDTLSSSTESLIPQIDSSIESHIRLRSIHQLNRTVHVSFVSGCMASQFAILTSVEITLTVSRVLPMHLVESKKTGYKLADFTANHLTMPYNVFNFAILSGAFSGIQACPWANEPPSLLN